MRLLTGACADGAAQAGAFSSALPWMSSGEPSPAKKLRTDGMAARRAVTFVTGNAKKLQEVWRRSVCAPAGLLTHTRQGLQGCSPGCRSRMRPHARVYVHTYAHVCTHARMMHACIHVCMHACMYACTYACIYECKHTHALTHTHTRTRRTRTYAHTTRQVQKIMGDAVPMISQKIDLPELQGTPEDVSREKCKAKKTKNKVT